MLSPTLHCAECGAPIRGSLGLSVCPGCALRAAIDLGQPEEDEPRAAETSRFGDYELLEEIARGGMGVVYRARQRSLGRIVALKVLLGGVFAGPDGKRRLHAEAAAAGRLRHPNIVAVHEAGEVAGQPFYSMDFVEGRTLAELIRTGALTSRRAAQYVAAIAEAVQHAHSEGVLHRDLKPSNVLIDASDQPRVTDFGLAKHFTTSGTSSTNHQNLTHTGQVLGSPAYMPPEQALGRAADVGPGSDVYSLGAILYELLVGRPPFQGETPQAVIEEVKVREPVPLRRLNGSVPFDLETVCLKCLEKQPVRRYPTAGELANDLKRFLRSEPVQARPISTVEKGWRWACRHPLPAALSLISVLLLVSIALIASISATRIRASRDEARARLADSFVSEARAVRISGEPGHRDAALRQISEARQIDSSGRLRHRLRREAIAALARADVRRVTATNLPISHDLMLICFDPAFERCAMWNEADKSLSIFRLIDAKLLQKLEARRPDEIIAFSPDGRFLVLRYRSAVGVWDTASGAVALGIDESEGIGGSVSGAFNTDGLLFGRGELNGRFVIYKASSNGLHRLREWPLPRKAPIGGVVWSPDGSSVTVAVERRYLAMCDAETGEVRWEAKHGSSEQWGLAGNGPLQFVAAHAQPDVVVFYDSLTGAEIRQINVSNDPSAATAFSADGLTLATCTERFGIRLFHTVTGRSLVSDSAPSWHLHFDRDGRRLGTLFDDGRPAWLEWLPSVGMDSLSAVSSGENQVLSFSPDGRWLVSLTLEGPVLWDVLRRQRVATMKIPNAVYAAFDPEARWLRASSGGSFFEVEIRALLERTNSLPIKIASGTGFWGIASSRRNELIAVADHKGNSIQLLDQTRRLARTLGPLNLPGYVEFSPDGRWLACAAGLDIVIWDMDALDLSPKHLPGGEPAPRFSPDGQWLLPLGREPRLWKTGSWEPGPSLPIESNNTSGAVAAFSPDGRWLAVTQRDREIHLIDFATRQTAAIFEGPGEGRVVDLAFSLDSELLASARDRGEVQLWNLPTVRRELAKLQLDW